MDDYTPNKEQLTPFEGDVHGTGACEAVEDCLCVTDRTKCFS